MTIGFKLINEMSKEEMLEEIVAHNRAMLESADLDKSQLASMVVDSRVEALRRRLIKEAGLKRGPLGILGSMTEDEDDE